MSLLIIFFCSRKDIERICSTYMRLVLLQAFREIQKLLVKTNGKMVGDVMTPSPLVVREHTNLEDAAR